MLYNYKILCVFCHYKEAQAFSNLKVSYSELEHLSFLSLRIGRIPKNQYEALKDSLEGSAVVIKLGNDSSHVLVASSKKNSAQVDLELKKLGFLALEIPKDFQGVPQDVLDGLADQKKKVEEELAELEARRSNFAETHKDKIHALIKAFAIGVQISEVIKGLESTELVYRITGWVPLAETQAYMQELDNITSGRIAFREYSPFEVPSVVAGKEQVPVKLTHGKFVKSFERMIFSN